MAINTDSNTALLHKLFQYTLSDDPALRAAAYKAFSNFNPPDTSVVSCLRNGLLDPEPSVRKAASLSLLNLGYYNKI